MTKYNELMENAVVTPEMKSRIMSAVSAAIKEQSKEPAAGKFVIREKPKVAEDNSKVKAEVTKMPAKKKSGRPVIVLVSTIAAGLLIVAGVVYFFSGYLGKSHGTAETVNEQKNNTNYINQEISQVFGDSTGSQDVVSYDANGHDDAAATEVEDVSETTADRSVDGADSTDAAEAEASGSMGDERLDRISKALPFDMKGHGFGQEGVADKELFFGNNGERAMLISSDKASDIDYYLQDDPDNYMDDTTPDGTVVRYYRVVFGNVEELGKDETSTEYNAAYFTENGKFYLLVFSDPQSPEAMCKVVDAL